MPIFRKYLYLIPLIFLLVACSSPSETKKIKIPDKITFLFVTQPSCPSCDELEETMKLPQPTKLLRDYFEIKKIYLGEKLPDGLSQPNGTPTVYFLGANNELLLEPMIGKKTEQGLIDFLEDALLEFKNTYKVDLVKKMQKREEEKKKENNKTNNTPHIASIPEASGISFCQNSNSLVVANDEGTFYELSLSGDIISKHKLGKYDLEGVVCEEKNFIFAIEGGSLLKVNRQTLQSKKFKVTGIDFKISKKHGIEGITKIDDLYYLSIQAKKKKKEAKLLVVKLGKNYAKVQKVIEHGIIDSAGLQYHDNKLYVVSDKKDKLYVYDLKHQKVIKKIKLPKFAQEGITFDEEGFVYFADDDGAVFKYTQKEMHLK